MTSRIDYDPVIARSLAMRDHEIQHGDTHLTPHTAQELTDSTTRFAALLKLLSLPEFAPLQLEVGLFAEQMMRDGFLTESEYMVIGALAHLLPEEGLESNS